MGILKRLDKLAEQRIDRAIATPAPTPTPRDEVAQKRAEKQQGGKR